MKRIRMIFADSTNTIRINSTERYNRIAESVRFERGRKKTGCGGWSLSPSVKVPREDRFLVVVIN